MNRQFIQECIVSSIPVGNDVVMAKNRDRTYKPSMQVVRDYIDGVEIVYIEDIDTDWSEGMNSYGIGILNATLNVGFDENERIIVRKKGKKSRDGAILREALSKTNIDDVTRVILKKMVIGHTLISDGNKLYTLEIAQGYKPRIQQTDISKLTVRTNHGILLPGTGYTEGENYKSTQIRKISAEDVLSKVQKYEDVANLLRKRKYNSTSMLNMTRKTPKIFTTSQIVINLSKKIFNFYLIDEYTDQFLGIVNKCPVEYKTKIDIKIYRVKPVEQMIDNSLSNI